LERRNACAAGATTTAAAFLATEAQIENPRPTTDPPTSVADITGARALVDCADDSRVAWLLEFSVDCPEPPLESALCWLASAEFPDASAEPLDESPDPSDDPAEFPDPSDDPAEFPDPSDDPAEFESEFPDVIASPIQPRCTPAQAPRTAQPPKISTAPKQ
jgi:hypothetical protein